MNYLDSQFSSVQYLNRVQFCVTPWTAACQASLSITNSRVYSNLCPLSQWCHPIISSCRPLLLLPSIFPNIRVFSNESALCIRWPNYIVSDSASVLPMNIQDWFPLGWSGWISLHSKGLSRVFSYTTVQKLKFFSAQVFFFIAQLSHPYMTTRKTIVLTRWALVEKVMSLLFNMLSSLVIILLPMSKSLLISWLQSSSAGILEPCKNKVWHCFHCFHIYVPWSDGTGCHDLSFLKVEL